MVMAKRDIVAGLVLITFSAWYIYQIGNLPERSIMPNTPSPSFFPTIIVAVVLLLSVSLLIKGAIALSREGVGKSEPFAGHKTVLALVIFAVYLAALPYAGFVIASVLFFAALMYLYGSRNPLMIGGASVVLPVALFVIFRYAFQIILPRAYWTSRP